MKTNGKISVRKIQVGILFGITFIAVFVWVIALSSNRGHELRVVFLDVGQGDAIFIEVPNGNRVLIDGGPPSGKILSELGAMMSFFERDISVIIATHPDQDHIGGLPDVFARYFVQALVEPDLYSGNGVYETMEKIAEKDGAKKIVARAGEIIRLDKNTTLEIMYPEKKFPPGVEVNISSVVVKLTYGNISFLFTGDLPAEQEKMLVEKYGQALNVDVLKFGHHGSKTSTSPEFLAVTSPKYGVVSVGADNKYGHPNKETLDLAEKDKVKVVRTDEEGRIVFETDGVTLSQNSKGKSQK
jgi:competence protein ComEC